MVRNRAPDEAAAPDHDAAALLDIGPPGQRAAGRGPTPSPARAPTPGELIPRQRQRPSALPSRPRSWKPALRVVVVVAVSVGAVVGALGRLSPVVDGQTGRAYLLTVSIAAAVVLTFKSRPGRAELDIHDRQVDYLVGLPLLGVAVFIVTALPARFGDAFWASHADLGPLPPLVAGAIALVFGTRALWRVRFPLMLFAAAMVPLPDRAAQEIATPVIELVELVAPNLAGWSVPNGAAPGSGTLGLTSAGQPVSTVDFAGAFIGSAGVLAGLILAGLVAASAPNALAAPRWGLSALGIWLVVALLRAVSALAAGPLGNAAAARAVLGLAGDAAVLAVWLVAVGAAMWRHAGRDRESGWTAAYPRRRVPVPRSRAALVVLVAAGVLLGVLGTVLAPDLAGAV